MKKYWKHFKVIFKHKMLVMKLCFKAGQYKRGLLHDLSKFGLTEFFSSAKYFQGNRSPIEAEKEVDGYSLAWQHHKGHNPHHWEYWIDNVGTRANTPIKIPYEYVVEMICDWVGAGIIYSRSKCDFSKPYAEPYEYYKTHLLERIFHEETQQLIEEFLGVIECKGVNTFCQYSKEPSVKLFYERGCDEMKELIKWARYCAKKDTSCTECKWRKGSPIECMEVLIKELLKSAEALDEVLAFINKQIINRPFRDYESTLESRTYEHVKAFIVQKLKEEKN